jgi:hypothetical protein
MAKTSPPATASVSLASGTSRSTVVLFGGLALIVASLLTTNAYAIVFHNIFRRPADAVSLPSSAAHLTGLADLGLQVVVVLILFGLASISEPMSNLAIALLVAMWLVFIIRTAGSAGVGASTSH